MAIATSLKKLKVPPPHDWRTTDTDEINKRRLRAHEEAFVISNVTPAHPVFSNFKIQSASGRTYSVEIRGFELGESACECVDFRTNGLGLCKHIEAIHLHLKARYKRFLKSAQRDGSNRIEITLDPAAETVRLRHSQGKLPRLVTKWFDSEGRMLNGLPEEAIQALRQLRDTKYPEIRLSQEIDPWLENRRRIAERQHLRREYELKVQSGEWPPYETTVPLFPYQRVGMLHLAFSERALLADEMGLGKTIQAIAACALLHRLGKARRVLVITPASLKTEWEEQIRKFTTLKYQVVFGGKVQRLKAYSTCGARPDQADCAPPFFTIINYEQAVADTQDVNRVLAPDVVVLDEAQRIKNWGTKTAQAVKQLRSRYAFVLTGTPIENRIDELHSLMDFLNPAVLGPLFRFNRDFYELDERGRPAGYRNLDVLHERIKPFILRRRKAEVETELPERTDHNHFVSMSELQKQNYATHEQEVSKLVSIAERRPLTKQEQEKLQRELAMMRMICDTNFILDPQDRTCPKLAELEKRLEECSENGAKVIIFSEWERMLQLARDLCESMGIGYAWHTGTVPQLRRRAQINAFKEDPACRVFLSTDSGATGLNLQNASVVINCDLPWNPAKLEQRIARAWRKNQTRHVTVINLISENTIEHRMLETLALKQTVAISVLDRPGEVKEVKLRSNCKALVERLQQLVSRPNSPTAQTHPVLSPSKEQAPASGAAFGALPADPALAFTQAAAKRLGVPMVRCEERYPEAGQHSVLMVVVERDASSWREKLADLHAELLGLGNAAPPAPAHLEVIDRATEEALQRLIAAGIISKTTRASRPLFPAEDSSKSQPLSAAEHAKSKAHRDNATRKLKIATVLGESGFCEEARPPLLEAIHAIGCSRAVEHRLTEPSELKEVFEPPLSYCLAGAIPMLNDFADDTAAAWRPAAECVAKLLS